MVLPGTQSLQFYIDQYPTADMSQATRHGGPIDPFCRYDLHDVIDGDVELDPMEDGAFDYFGLMIMPQGRNRYHVSLEGHVGSIHSFDASDYDDVLELVEDLTGLVIRRGDYDYRDDKEGLVEWAGKIMTTDKGRADEEPGLYIHIPDDAPSIE